MKNIFRNEAKHKIDFFFVASNKYESKNDNMNMSSQTENFNYKTVIHLLSSWRKKNCKQI